MFDRKTTTAAVLSWFTLAICLLGCAYYFLFFYNRAFVEVEIEAEHKSIFKLYWTSGDIPFSEKKSSSVRLKPGKGSYTFFFTDLGKVDKIRVDPFQYEGKGTIHRLTLSQSGFQTVEVDLPSLVPLNHIEKSEAGPTGLLIESTGSDPFLLLQPDLARKPVNWALETARYVLICSLILLIVAGLRPLGPEFRFVPLMFAAVLTLVIVMAATSKRNAHPDEYVHLEASKYYQDHWLPPEVDDPEIEQTYSVYGVSRLNNGEVYYLLAGKFSRLLEVLAIDQLVALRSFNILLFGLIFLYTVKSVPARLVALPFLLTPQLWYIFSYCVSDALGLFLCFLAGCELVRDNSSLNRLLDGDRKAFLGHLALVTILLGSMFLLKVNYYPFILLVYAYIGWHWLKNPEGRRSIISRFAAVTIMALVFAGLRIGADYYVNGADRSEKIALMQEKTAHHWYKPSTELNKKHVSMYFKQRGVTLKEMVVKYKWFAHSFQTGFGKYGYFTISGSETYYRLMKWSVIVFLVFLGGAVAFRGDTEGRLLALLVCGLAFALVAASVHRSWTIDFQAQGRYLFPILPMIGVVLARNRLAVDNKMFILLTMHLFLLSLYSFIFIALPAIPRA